MTERYIRGTDVAVLISRGHGAGWSTWANKKYWPQIVFDPVIVDILINDRYSFDERQSRLREICYLKYPDMYSDSVRSLSVQWVPQGTEFRVTEYDGSEAIELRDQTEWLTA